jgi:hypothetical protein
MNSSFPRCRRTSELRRKNKLCRKTLKQYSRPSRLAYRHIASRQKANYPPCKLWTRISLKKKCQSVTSTQETTIIGLSSRHPSQRIDQEINTLYKSTLLCLSLRHPITILSKRQERLAERAAVWRIWAHLSSRGLALPSEWWLANQTSNLWRSHLSLRYLFVMKIKRCLSWLKIFTRIFPRCLNAVKSEVRLFSSLIKTQ